MQKIELLTDLGKFSSLSLDSTLNKNKAGYTATSCGRVGRGGNAHFPTFQLELDRPTNRPTNQPTNGWTDGQSLL